MSFSYSQSLIDDLPSSNPGAGGSFSQEPDNSQDSGYSASGGTQASSSNYFPRTSRAFPPFSTRRTLPRPPTWPNINIQQPQLRGGSSSSKWRFGGRQEKEGRSALERDLQQHLQEISNQTKKVPGKLSTVVTESVKFMQEVYKKEGQDGRNELDKIGSAMHDVKEQIQDQECNTNEIIEDITKLEAVLAECESLCKEVTKGKEKNKERLIKLREQIHKSSFSQTMINDSGMIQSFSWKNTDVLTRTKRTGLIDRKDKVFSPSPSGQVMTNPLPSIRRLPTLPLLAAAAPGGVRPHQGVCGAREETVDLGRRTLRTRRFWDMEE